MINFVSNTHELQIQVKAGEVFWNSKGIVEIPIRIWSTSVGCLRQQQYGHDQAASVHRFILIEMLVQWKTNRFSLTEFLFLIKISSVIPIGAIFYISFSKFLSDLYDLCINVII